MAPEYAALRLPQVPLRLTARFHDHLEAAAGNGSGIGIRGLPTPGVVTPGGPKPVPKSVPRNPKCLNWPIRGLAYSHLIS